MHIHAIAKLLAYLVSVISTFWLGWLFLLAKRNILHDSPSTYRSWQTHFAFGWEKLTNFIISYGLRHKRDESHNKFIPLDSCISVYNIIISRAPISMISLEFCGQAIFGYFGIPSSLPPTTQTTWKSIFIIRNICNRVFLYDV